MKTSGGIAITSSADEAGANRGDGNTSISDGTASAASGGDAAALTANVSLGVGDDRQANEDIFLGGDRSEEDSGEEEDINEGKYCAKCESL